LLRFAIVVLLRSYDDFMDLVHGSFQVEGRLEHQLRRFDILHSLMVPNEAIGAQDARNGYV